eukprot:GEMP01159561.1.p1 GENE.GEMP01159561.1~~GEMP01159561.1.p1  ORF type:complete len:104 (+),score=2.94 GEMP01159561.1:36-314(+)
MPQLRPETLFEKVFVDFLAPSTPALRPETSRPGPFRMGGGRGGNRAKKHVKSRQKHVEKKTGLIFKRQHQLSTPTLTTSVKTQYDLTCAGFL